MNITMNRKDVYLGELHIWECSDGRLRMRRFPDPLLQESTNNQSAIACREAFLVSVYFIKKNHSSKGCCSFWQRIVNPPQPISIAEVMQYIAACGKKSEVVITGCDRTEGQQAYEEFRRIEEGERDVFFRNGHFRLHVEWNWEHTCHLLKGATHLQVQLYKEHTTE